MERLSVCVLLVVQICCLGLSLALQPRVLSSQPEWIKKPCRRKDPHLNECLNDLFQGLFPYMAKGIPEVGVPKFEPLFIEKISISKGHGAVTLNGNFNRILAHGPSNTTTRQVKLDLAKGRLEIKLHIPVIRTESKYDLRGNILLLPIVGVGEARLLLRNVTTDVYMKVVFPKLPTGEEVMSVSDMKVDFRMSNVRVHLDNLFNGNKVLGHTVNTFLNKNALEVVDELKENIGDGLTDVFRRIMNDAFGRIPTNFWLLHDEPSHQDQPSRQDRTSHQDQPTRQDQLSHQDQSSHQDQTSHQNQTSHQDPIKTSTYNDHSNISS